MKITKMVCDCCGEEFFTEYYEGGYIDHCINFSDNRDEWGKDIKRDIEMVFMNGNEIRNVIDIQERTACYNKCKSVPKEYKKEISKRSDKLIKLMDSEEEKAKEILEQLTPMQLKFLLEQSEYVNCYGTGSGVARDLIFEYDGELK